MAFWPRGRRDEPPEEPDPAFPFLSERQAQRIRELSRLAFAERGTEVVVHADHLEADDGRQFGLSNLCAMCMNAEGGEKAWPTLVDRHVQRILAAMNDTVTIADLDRDDVLARIYLRLMDSASLPEPTWDRFSYARPVCGNMLEVLALDSPESVTLMRDEDVAPFGLDALRDAGLTNLLSDQPDRHEVVDATDGVRFHVLLGNSVYTASKLLVFRDVLRRALGERDYPNGVLVAAPYRHQLAFSPVEGREVVHAATLLARLAQTGYREGVSPLSPNAYWWNDGSLEQVSHFGPDGDLTIDGNGSFGEVVKRLLED